MPNTVPGCNTINRETKIKKIIYLGFLGYTVSITSLTLLSKTGVACLPPGTR